MELIRWKRCHNCRKKLANPDEHYCPNCGYNLSSKVEKADLFFWGSGFIIALLLMYIALVAFPYRLFRGVCIDGGCFEPNPNDNLLMLYVIPITALVVAIVCRIIASVLYRKNINK